jgi:hypothetical protein
MSRSKSESLLGLTESFFHNYLQHTPAEQARIPCEHIATP